MLKRLGFVGVAAVTVMAGGLLTHVAPVQAASGTYVVTTNADAAPNESDCSGSNTCTLRDAVVLSDAAGGTNTITFAASVTQPIALTLGPLQVIGQALTITGNGTGVTVIDGAGNNVSGIFDIVNNGCPTTHTTAGSPRACAVHSASSPRTVSVNGSLTLTDATLRNGANTAGGGAVAVTVNADFNATDVVFSGNTSRAGNGGAISSAGGNLDIVGSSFTQNAATGTGGAIDESSSANTVDITTSTFHDNVSTGAGELPTQGGAVDDVLDNGGSLSITQSTFSGNGASGDGGAVWAGIEGFAAASSTISIDNSTFTGNSAGGDGGAIIDNIDTASLVNDTIVGNSSNGNNTGGTGGGVAAPSNSDVGTAKITFSDDLLVSNSPSNCDYPTDSPATVITADHSIDTGQSCQMGFANGNAQDQSVTGLQLDTQLRDNGGPTQTIALRSNSTAVDAGGNSTCQAVDQRGVPRPQHGTCDVGAFEVDESTTTITASQAYAGGPVTLTATVAGNSADAGTPQGSVEFTKNGLNLDAPNVIVLGTANLNSSGVATLTLSLTSAADPLFGATYTPTNGFFPSSNSVSYTPVLESVPVPNAGTGLPFGALLLVLDGLVLVAVTRRRR